jgi:gamma-glutamyltranspeptidase / glutathione hydrolase
VVVDRADGDHEPGGDLAAARAGGREQRDLALARREVGGLECRLRLVVGAAGGSAIPDYIAQTFLGVTVDGMDAQRAIAQGHWSGQEISSNCRGFVGAYSELEEGSEAAALLPELRSRSHPCARLADLRSGLTAIEVAPDGRLLGAADPRRDGAAVGG